MATAEFNFDDDVVPAALVAAKRAFRGRWDRGELIVDTIHEAWIGWRLCPTAPPQAHARYAALRVKSGRHFRQSSRSYEGPNPRRNPKPLRVPFDPSEVLAKASENPAVVGGFRIDFDAWLEGLAVRQREIVKACLAGETGQEMAKRFVLSEGRVSQLRRELYEDWLALMG